MRNTKRLPQLDICDVAEVAFRGGPPPLLLVSAQRDVLAALTFISLPRTTA